MNLDQLNKSGHIIFQAVVGSKLYGLDVSASDTDYKGVFKLPNRSLLTLDNTPAQISDEKNDTTFYEVKRFLQLVQSSNPNILELLFVPDDKIIHKDPIFDIILKHKEAFITKQIRNSLGGYAIAQIKKARGQNKKIVNPVDKIRKSLLDFCYILTPVGTVPIKEWLEIQRLGATNQSSYGVSSVGNAHNTFYIYHNDNKHDFRGILGKDANELRMSSIPKECLINYNIMYCNAEGYSSYCKEYKEYWEWVEKRNPERYKSNEKHGKGYDGKNLMHCFRLLEMGIEVLDTGVLNVRRPNREWLLKVRAGEFDYDRLVDKAEEKLQLLDKAVTNSALPETVDNKLLNDILMEIRDYE